MLGISNEKIGTAADSAAINALQSNPELVDMLVGAIIKALITNIPALIEQISAAIEKSKQPKPAA